MKGRSNAPPTRLCGGTLEIVGLGEVSSYKTRNGKNEKYLEDCQAQFLSFTPLLINTLGKFSEKFIETLDFITRKLANTSDLTINWSGKIQSKKSSSNSVAHLINAFKSAVSPMFDQTSSFNLTLSAVGPIASISQTPITLAFLWNVSIKMHAMHWFTCIIKNYP